MYFAIEVTSKQVAWIVIEVEGNNKYEIWPFRNRSLLTWELFKKQASFASRGAQNS